MVDYKITNVVDNVFVIYHCTSCFMKLFIIATSRCFSRRCPYKYSKSINPDLTDRIRSDKPGSKLMNRYYQLNGSA